MTTTIKTFTRATLVFACAVWLTSPAWAAGGIHPDGATTIYRGGGPSVPTTDGYVCTLFDAHGVRIGAIQFHADGRIDLTVGTEQAHFAASAPGLTDLHDMDVNSFPDVPLRFRQPGYRLMTFSARSVVGTNMSVVAPVTDFAQSISVVEARCVYIVDADGNVVFCLNCIFAVS